MTHTDFALHLKNYLEDYLPSQRNVSPNTVKAYRDVFVILLRYCRDEKGIRPERLQLKYLDATMVKEFIAYLGKERHCSTRTQNHRLAALHAFFRYVQTEEPQLLLHCQRILAIPFKRKETGEVKYLSPDDVAAILAQPDMTTRKGRRDAVLLSLLYDTGARVQELIDITIQDVRLDAPALVRLSGKGRKKRTVPLMKQSAQLLREYMNENDLLRDEQLSHPLFFNRYGNRLSRSGVHHIVDKYCEQARATDLFVSEKVSPHTFRHTKAMHLLQAGNPLIVIKHFLGHSDVTSTQIYVKADLEMKREALEKAAGSSPSVTLPSWQKNKEILNWLRSL